MANENDKVKQEGAENNEHPKHHSWLEDMVNDAHKADNEFPLSGAETEEEFSASIHTEESGEDKPHHSWVSNIVDQIQKLDVEFPLSGAETEEDFSRIDDTEEGEEKPE